MGGVFGSLGEISGHGVTVGVAVGIGVVVGRIITVVVGVMVSPVGLGVIVCPEGVGVNVALPLVGVAVGLFPDVGVGVGVLAEVKAIATAACAFTKPLLLTPLATDLSAVVSIISFTLEFDKDELTESIISAIAAT